MELNCELGILVLVDKQVEVCVPGRKGRGLEESQRGVT